MAGVSETPPAQVAVPRQWLGLGVFRLFQHHSLEKNRSRPKGKSGSFKGCFVFLSVCPIQHVILPASVLKSNLP